MYLLNQANQAVRSMLEQDLRALNLTGIQYTVLSIVGSRQGISSAELSRRFFVTPQTMNEIVTGLERRGLLARTESTHSRRILTTQLTPDGVEILGIADAMADRIEASAFSHFSESDFAELRRLLRLQLDAIRGQASIKREAVGTHRSDEAV